MTRSIKVGVGKIPEPTDAADVGVSTAGGTSGARAAVRLADRLQALAGKSERVAALDLRDGVFVAGFIVSHVSDRDERLEAWDLAGAAEGWSHAAGFVPVLLRGEDNLVVAIDGEHVRGFDARDEKPLWENTESDPSVGVIAVAPDGGVIVARNRRVLCLDGQSGKPRWQVDAPVARTSTLTLGDDCEIHLLDLSRYIRIASAMRQLVFERDLPRDELPTMRGWLGCIEIAAEHVVACDQRGLIVAVERARGSVDWQSEDRGPRAGRDVQVATDVRLYALAFDGSLACFEETA